MLDITVVIGTYGDEQYRRWARDRAVPSVPESVPVIHIHGESLAQGRNEGLSCVESEWVCFLDADDELTPGYFDAMATGTADLRGPSVEYTQGDTPQRAYVPKVAGHRHDCTGECLPQGNWLVIGSVVRTELIRSIGGFREFEVYEDWDAWLRCWVAGATVEAIPAAVYRAYVRRDSRNRGPSIESRNAVHHQIIESIYGEKGIP